MVFNRCDKTENDADSQKPDTKKRRIDFSEENSIKTKEDGSKSWKESSKPNMERFV